jgi:MFS family permease
MFAGNGAALAALLPWYPLAAARLGLSVAQFGLVVAGVAAGAIVSSALPSPLVTRFGPGRVSVFGTLVLVVAAASTGWAGSGLVMAACLFGTGLADVVVDVAQNVAGVRAQQAAGRPVMSSMHALWSLGAAASGAGATAAAASGWPMGWYLVGNGLVALALVSAGAALAARTVEQDPAAPSANQPQTTQAAGRRWRTVAVAAWPLVAIALCGAAIEDVANDWAGLAGVGLAGMSAGSAGLVVTVAIAAQCVGRFSGDYLIHIWSRGSVARLGGALAALGGLTAALAQGPMLLCAGFALAGVGCATLIPSAFSAAAELPGISQAAGVTLIGWLMRVGFLATSPLVGLISQLTNLRFGLGILIIAGLAAAALASRLDQPARLRAQDVDQPT